MREREKEEGYKERKGVESGQEACVSFQEFHSLAVLRCVSSCFELTVVSDANWSRKWRGLYFPVKIKDGFC